MASIFVSDSASLTAAFSIAEDGDEILLQGGDYDLTLLKNRSFENGIRIASVDADDRAVFTEQLRLIGVSGVTLEQVSIFAEDVAVSHATPRLQVTAAERITVRDVEIAGRIPNAEEGADPAAEGVMKNDVISGFPYEVGVQVRDVTDVTFEQVEVRDVRVAFSTLLTENLTLREVEIHNVREGVDMVDARGMLIEGSHFHDLTAWRTADENPALSDHPDMIQYWGNSASQFGLDGVTIRNNLFDQAEGTRSQMLFGHMNNAPEGVVAQDFTVTGNVLIGSHSAGIALAGVQGALVEGNVLLPVSGDVDRTMAPAVSAVRGATGIEVRGNVFVGQREDAIFGWHRSDEELEEAGLISEGNHMLSMDQDAGNSWAAWAAAEGFAGGAASLAFRLRAHLGAEDSVAALTALIGETDAAAEVSDDGAPSAELLSVRAEPESPVDLTLEIGDLSHRLGDGAANRLLGASGNDLLAGGAGDDFLRGRDGDDALLGGTGDDELHGCGGDDLMVGGLGADKFRFDARVGAQTDTIADLAFGQGDKVVLTGFAEGTFSDALLGDKRLAVFGEGAGAIIDGVADILEISLGQGIELIGWGQDGAALRFSAEVTGAEGPSILAFEGISVDRIQNAGGFLIPQTGPEAETSYGSDVFSDEQIDAALAYVSDGGSGALRIMGAGGDELLTGGYGDDRLVGRGGADALIGGQGDDVLIAGRGDDLLLGGAGADTFRFMLKGDMGADRIADLDFGAGDRVIIAGNVIDSVQDLYDFAEADGIDFVQDDAGMHLTVDTPDAMLTLDMTFADALLA